MLIQLPMFSTCVVLCEREEGGSMREMSTERMCCTYMCTFTVVTIHTYTYKFIDKWTRKERGK